MYTLSSLQLHPRACIVCDEDATNELRVSHSSSSSLPRSFIYPPPPSLSVFVSLLIFLVLYLHEVDIGSAVPYLPPMCVCVCVCVCVRVHRCVQ